MAESNKKYGRPKKTETTERVNNIVNKQPNEKESLLKTVAQSIESVNTNIEVETKESQNNNSLETSEILQELNKVTSEVESIGLNNETKEEIQEQLGKAIDEAKALNEKVQKQLNNKPLITNKWNGMCGGL